MNSDMRCKDEDLHRYIDKELDDESRSRVKALLEEDPSLAARLQEYRSVDQALRDAFDEIEPPRNTAPKAPIRVRRRRWAAAVLLPAAFLAGWLVHSMVDVSQVRESLAGGVNLDVQGREHLNTVFHIDVDESAAMEAVLDRAEAVLTAFADQGAHVEVVANGAGLNLLRADTSALANRVRKMMDKYDNLTFVACANTIRRMKEQGVDVLLIDRTHASETAIDHVVERLQAGWTYIKI